MRRVAAALCALILLMCMPALADGAQREELQYAQQFTIDHLEGGCTLLTIAGSDRFLVVPEGCAALTSPAGTTGKVMAYKSA